METEPGRGAFRVPKFREACQAGTDYGKSSGTVRDSSGGLLYSQGPARPAL